MGTLKVIGTNGKVVYCGVGEVEVHRVDDKNLLCYYTVKKESGKTDHVKVPKNGFLVVRTIG